MAYEWIAAAAAAAAQGIGAVAGQHPSKARRYAKEMAVFNNDLARENWRMQNEYDSPKAQMQRYQEAGLNPNLIYSQSNTGGTIQSGSANFDADTMVPNEGKSLRGIGDAIATYQNIRSMQIQNQNANLVGKLTSEEIRSKQLGNDLAESILPYQIESKALGVQDMTFRVLYKNIADYNKTLAQTNTEIKKLDEIAANVKVKGAQYDKIVEEKNNLVKMRDLLQGKIELCFEQIKDLGELRPYKKVGYQASAYSAFGSGLSSRANARKTDIDSETLDERNVVDFYKDIYSGWDKIPLVGGPTKAALVKAATERYKKIKQQVKGMYRNLKKQARGKK